MSRKPIKLNLELTRRQAQKLVQAMNTAACGDRDLSDLYDLQLIPQLKPHGIEWKVPK